MTCKVVALITT